jgi:excinuclease UvrABC nuclease subunit
MPWGNPTSYEFSRMSIVRNAPEQSGVYALYHRATWIYIGEAENIRAQLLQHLDGGDTFVTVYPALSFSYVLTPAAARAWRQDELIREFHPICNPKLG